MTNVSQPLTKMWQHFAKRHVLLRDGGGGESSPLPLQCYFFEKGTAILLCTTAIHEVCATKTSKCKKNNPARVASIRRNITSPDSFKWCGAAHAGKPHNPYRTIHHVLMETASQSTLSTYPYFLSWRPRCSGADIKERAMPKYPTPCPFAPTKR